MKYMKLGTKSDTFYTQEATRSIVTDVSTDLIIQISNTKYLLHKFPLLLKCGLLQRLCSEPEEGSPSTVISLHNLPGGEQAFELCAKFCYNITISLSAHNFIPAMAAASHLQMTESVFRGNLIDKLQNFFRSFILHGWKDSIVALQKACILSWNDEQKIKQTCLESIVDKILTHPSLVSWSYTYTRPGFSKKKHRSAPKDWWTEDISDFDIDLFRSIIYAIRSKKLIFPALIGEALHVFACKQLPDPDEADSIDQSCIKKHKRVLEAIASMIPAEPRSVSGRFFVKLLKIAVLVGASPSVKAELVRGCGLQLDEVKPSDLLFCSSSVMPGSYDTDIVEAILENFLRQFRTPEVETESRLGLMISVALILDSYLEIVAHDPGLSATKFLDLAAVLPDNARLKHDGLYLAIDAYIKKHAELSKSDRKQLCQLIDCNKLSSEVRSDAVSNDRMPLRTIVQLLFIQQSGVAGSPHELPSKSPFNDPLKNACNRQERRGKQRQEMTVYRKLESKEAKKR